MFIHIGRQALGETTNKSSDFIVLPRRSCVSSENFSIVSILSGTSLGGAQKIKKFFEHDYPGICRRAGNNPAGIKAVVIDGMPKSPSFDNGSEEKLTDFIEKQVDYEKVVKAIRALDEMSKDIIMYNIIEKQSNSWCYRRFHMTSSRYDDYKKYALNAFADSYEYQTFGETDLHEYLSD